MSHQRGVWSAVKISARLPVLAFSLLIVASIAAACAIETRRAPAEPEFADRNARRYQLYFDSSADPNENVLQVRQFDGHVRMADLEGIFGDLKSLPLDDGCNLVAGPVMKDGRLWQATITPDLVGVNLVSVGTDGTRSSAFDFDGDRVVDLLDIATIDSRRFSLFSEAMGLDVFKNWLQGRDPFCSSELVQQLGLPDLGCDSKGSASGTEGSSTDAGYGAASGIPDPVDVLCSEYDTGPTAGILAKGPNRSRSYRIESPVLQKWVEGSSIRRDIHVSYSYDQVTHEFLGAQKLIIDTDTSTVPPTIVQITHERVDAQGHGTRETIRTAPDGSQTTEREDFELDGGDLHDLPYNYRNREDLADPPSPPPPGGATQGDPGPEGDDSMVAEFCQRRENHQSGVERAAATDPSAISISCGDLVGAPTPNCKIFEWARRGDWRTVLEPPTDGGCDAFDDPDRQCEGDTVAGRIRKFLGETAELWSLNTPDVTLCSPLACDPANAAALRSYTSGEAVVACPAVAYASTPISAPVSTPSSGLRCDLFKDMEIGFVTLDWQPGQPMTLYTRMPGGVPGLETPIEGDDQPVKYSAMWGDAQTEDCEFIPGYPGRLYCTMAVPAGYAGSVRPFELYLSGCESPVYNNPRAEVPGGDGSSGGSAGDAGGACTLTQSDCISQGLVLDSANCQCIVFQ